MRKLACIRDLGNMMHRPGPGELMPHPVLNIHGRHRSADEIKRRASLVGHGQAWPHYPAGRVAEMSRYLNRPSDNP